MGQKDEISVDLSTILVTRSPNLKLIYLVLPSGPDTRPAMDEDEGLLCFWVHIDIVYHGGVISE